MDKKIIINKQVNDTSAYARIYYEGEKNTDVTVSKHTRLRDGNWEPANVNFAALGSIEPDRAREYARLIKAAAQTADALDHQLTN